MMTGWSFVFSPTLLAVGVDGYLNRTVIRRGGVSGCAFEAPKSEIGTQVVRSCRVNHSQPSVVLVVADFEAIYS